ncbi:NADPH-flavin oxidoreductase [Streptomyces laurentii]|uniref:NADPH-flavin oxidoreductase n=2 Tax=Streptomyces laurentii TaxID=39478 RepID=A0A160P3Y6_STRLU|nr:NADPH-flavin oxidoreductase [Streptomyces laurentii]
MGHAGMAATAVRYLRAAGAPTAAEAPPRHRRPALRAVRDGERAPVVGGAEIRRVLGHFASGVTIVTALDEDGPTGFACQSFASLSLDPPLVVFMVARTSTTWPRIARAGRFCVNVLGAEQGGLCRAFAVSGADKFAGVAWEPASATGSPRLPEAPAWVDCAINAVHTGGDHLIVVGRIAALGTAEDDTGAVGETPAEPLLFHRGRFGRFTPR